MTATVGHVHETFRPVRDHLETLALADPSYSAQLCVYRGDQVVVNLACGPDAALRELVGVYSVSKGVAATVIALLLDSGSLDLDRPVAHYWPEFAENGKARITVRQLLSHQAGLPALEEGVEPEHALDSRFGAARLAAQLPMWSPGATFGYHGITIGILMEELVRRITGAELQDLYEGHIRAPRNIDFYLGASPEIQQRYRDPLPPSRPAEPTASVEDDLAAASFGRLLRRADPLLRKFGPQSPAVRAKGPSAAGGLGSAEGLARLYAATLGNIGGNIARSSTFAKMAQIHVRGSDAVLNAALCFGIVFMKPHAQMPFASFRAFGHDGAGGALGYADPLHDIGFGYIPSRMPEPGATHERVVELSVLVRRCASEMG